jgi:naphthalene 1,2-dioxygenase ferredoxin component
VSTNPDWTDVAAVDDLFDGASIAVVVAEREIALHSVDGVPFATDNLCTHGAGRLCEGFLEGHEIECPLHQGRFDVRSGAPTCAPATEAIRCYPVRIEGGRVFVAL